jgi:hypothetical protein
VHYISALETLQAAMDDSSLLLRWTGIEEGRSFNYSINHNVSIKEIKSETLDTASFKVL